MTTPLPELSGEAQNLALRLPAPKMKKAKEHGFSDFQIATIFQTGEAAVRELRSHYGVV
jgi:carbamoyl-phosphate synthase large subunit